MKHISIHRQKYRHMAALLMICISCTLLLSGCSGDPKNFTVNGLTITLTKAFSEGKADRFDVYLKSDDVIFTAVEETSDELESLGYEIASLDDYAAELVKLNNKTAGDLVARSNYKYFLTTGTNSGASYTYVHCIFKESDSYWVCEFACKSKNYDKLEKKILKWADTIVFN